MVSSLVCASGACLVFGVLACGAHSIPSCVALVTIGGLLLLMMAVALPIALAAYALLRAIQPHAV
jgi:hypothetical protein